MAVFVFVCAMRTEHACNRQCSNEGAATAAWLQLISVTDRCVVFVCLIMMIDDIMLKPCVLSYRIVCKA